MLLGALPFYVYQVTGSALAGSGMFIAEILPMLLLSSVAGVFADRWDRKRVLVVADLLSGGLVATLILVRSPEWIPLIYVVGFLVSTVGQFASTAFSAFMPRLVEGEQLGPANSAFSVANNLGRLIGPGIGGLLMASAGLPAVVLVDAVSFVISGLLVLLILTRAEPAAASPERNSSPWRAVVGEWLAGLRLVRAERWIVVLFTVMGIATLGDSILTVLLAPYVSDVLKGDAGLFGLLLTIRGLGGLVGGLMISEVSRRLAPTRLIGLSAVILGLLLLVIVGLGTVTTTLALVALAGPAAIGFYVGSYTLLQGGVADEFRGRVFGALSTTSALTLLVGMTLAGTLGDLVGVVPMLSTSGILYVVAGVAALALLRPIAVSKTLGGYG